MPTLETDYGPFTFVGSDTAAAAKPTVVLLHGSASSALQWRKLAGALASRYRVLAPDLIGYGGTPMAARAPEMADEVAIVSALASAFPGPLHLVGHSYGGAVALEAARRLGRRVASLALFDPVAFHLLRAHGHEAWAEIEAVAARHIALVEAGEHQACARAFIDYWLSPGAFAAMPPDLQGYVVRTMRKIAAEWRMLFTKEGDVADYASIACPVLLMSGERTTRAAAGVAAILGTSLGGVSWRSLPEAGHMAPVTHPDAVNAAFAAFLDEHAKLPPNAANDDVPPDAEERRVQRR